MVLLFEPLPYVANIQPCQCDLGMIKWGWVKIKPPGIGPQVKSSFFPFTRASHLGYHSHLKPWILWVAGGFHPEPPNHSAPTQGEAELCSSWLKSRLYICSEPRLALNQHVEPYRTPSFLVRIAEGARGESAAEARCFSWDKEKGN